MLMADKRTRAVSSQERCKPFSLVIGKFEIVNEDKVEMLVSDEKLDNVIEALKELILTKSQLLRCIEFSRHSINKVL